jgi:hypothetical protein
LCQLIQLFKLGMLKPILKHSFCTDRT